MVGTASGIEKQLRAWLLMIAVFLTALVTFFVVEISDARTQETGRSFGYTPVSKERFDSFPKTSRYRSFLPEAVDLSARFPTPRDQGDLNSCVGWAVGYAARSYYAATAEMRGLNDAVNIPSPSYIYHSIRVPSDCQSGATIPSALVLLSSGSLSLADKPYSETCWRPSIAEQSKAKDFRIDNWFAVNPKRLDDIKGEVARGHPVIFGMDVGKAFIQLGRGQTYREAEGRIGPHAMTVVGYSDRKQAFKIINSWGTNWGDRGFAWIAYDKFAREVNEAYVMRVKSLVPTPRPKPIEAFPEDHDEEQVVVTPESAPAQPTEEKVVVVTPAPKPVNEQEEPTSEKKVVTKPETQPKPLVDAVSEDDCHLVTISQTGDRKRISGFVGTQGAWYRLRWKYARPDIDFDVQLRPWPQCEVLMTLGKRLNANDGPTVEVSDGRTSLSKGEIISIDIVTPKQPSYIYVSYVQADGSVVHLHQPSGPVQSPSKSKTRFVFGDGKEGRARFTVAEPFGREMIVVLASASPLFDGNLPEKQVERDYLSALRKALIYKADPKLPDRDVSAAFLGVETREE